MGSTELADLSEVIGPSAPDETTLIQRVASQLATGTTLSSLGSVLGAGADIVEEAVKALLELGAIRRMIAIEPPPLSSAPIRAVHRQNLIRRAAYLVKAARRLTTAAKAGQLRQGLQTEQKFLAEHLDATRKRVLAGREVAQVAQQTQNPDRLVGWYAVLDNRTSPECRRANGANFRFDQIPLIGFPGAVHPHCRCKPGPAHATNRMVDGPRPKEQAMTDALKGRAAARQAIDLANSKAYPDLERVPGKQNWVDRAGGLPSYIERIAKHLHYEKGMPISRAIAVAVNTVKRWAAGGTVTEHGTTKRITPETQAQAAKAVAEWEAKKARGRG